MYGLIAVTAFVSGYVLCRILEWYRHHHNNNVKAAVDKHNIQVFQALSAIGINQEVFALMQKGKMADARALALGRLINKMETAGEVRQPSQRSIQE